MEYEVGGVILSELVTAFTNLILAAICFYAFKVSKAISDYPGRASWSYFFLTLGAATFIGFFTHLFSAYDIHYFRLVGWVFSGMAAYFTQVASIEQVSGKKTGLFILISKIEFVLFLIMLYYFQTFEVVLVITVIALLVVLSIHGYGFVSKVLRGSELILLGFIISALTAVARLLKVSFHPIYFNYHDVAHLMMMVAAFVILAGVKQAAHKA